MYDNINRPGVQVSSQHSPERPNQSKLRFFHVLEDARNPLLDMIIRSNFENKIKRYQLITEVIGVASNSYESDEKYSLNGEYPFITIIEKEPKIKVVTRISERPTGEGQSAHCQLLDSLDMEVLYAGTAHFSNNTLLGWSNRSGTFKIPSMREYALQAQFPIDLFNPVT